VKVVLIIVIIGEKVINIVLKSEMNRLFWNNIFLQKSNLLQKGGSIVHVYSYGAPWG